MFSNFIESVLRNAGASALTETFVLIMLGVFALAIVLHKIGAWQAFTSYTATLLTSLGILGTFAGVVTGLLDFDSTPDQIDVSIGLLLQGLKTAFTSSLVGMTLSIIYKVLILAPFLSPSGSEREVGEVTIDSLYDASIDQTHYLRAIATAMAGKENTSVLKQLKHLCDSAEWLQTNTEAAQLEQKSSNEKQLGLLEKTVQALSDDGESSLTGQLKLARSDANDIGKALGAQLENSHTTLIEQGANSKSWFADQKKILESSYSQLDTIRLNATEYAAESSQQNLSIIELLERSPTETLIEALEDVIRDFNKHISEQFGENFKELNLAVGRMIEWQENYRQQIDTLQKSFESSAEAIGNCESSISAIEKSSESIPANMQSLSEILKTSQHQLSELDRHLKAFAELKDRAVESVPVLNGIVEDVARKVEKSTTAMLDRCEQGNKSFVEALDISVAAMSKSTGSLNAQLENTIKRTESELNVMLDGLRRAIEDQFRNSSDGVEKLIDKEFKNMEEVRQTQAANVMREMGAALTSITGQFTRDYGALVNAMKAIVESGHRRGI